MEIIFLENIKNGGRRGQTKSVSDGYARNYLIPKKLAMPATEALKNKFKHEQNLKNKITTEQTRQAQDAAHQLNGLQLIYKEKMSATGTLFHGISKSLIADELNKRVNCQFNEESIILEKPLKHVGQHIVYVRLNNQQYPITILIQND